MIDRLQMELVRYDRTSDASCFSAGAGLHRGSFRRTDRVVAGRGCSKCRRSRATRHDECDRPSSLRNGTPPICAVRALDGRLQRFRDGAPGAQSDRARKSVSSLMNSSPPSAIPGAFRHPDARLRLATASMRGRPQPDRCQCCRWSFESRIVPLFWCATETPRRSR